MNLILAVALSLLTTGPQPSDPPRTESRTLEQGLAEAIAAAMPDLRYPWQLEWTPFGSYSSRDIRWHLVGPTGGYQRDPLPVGVTRRTGSMSVEGGSASVAACGDDERVGALMLEASDIHVDDGDLAPELFELGVTATLLDRRSRPPIMAESSSEDLSPYYVAKVSQFPAYRLFRLERTGREPAFMTVTYTCTGPNTRSATHCWMHWTVELRAGPAPRAEPCLAPEEPWPQVSLD